ncbi:MAG: alanine dehydrogenase [Bacteroidetes bacterium GWE2_29_8]|nr:MAG: alanine dehydrogenase [Bacteroidetes bacterium GWE2_29_8]OFY20797.1 MAG: alanine dehydrogenase [Bacteroidetes bacterium GWF2_29_10]
MDNFNSKNISLSFATELMTQEERLDIKREKNTVSIGIPKEVNNDENRVALVPDAVNMLVNNGHKVIIESDAGRKAHFFNNEYADAGAVIAYEKSEVFQSDIILKISPLTNEEIEYIRNKQTIISTLHATIQSAEYFRKLMSKKVNCLAFELIKDKSDTFSVVRSMSEIAGNTSILIAAEYLSNINNGKGLMLGGFSGITPTEILILGAGTVGEFAARAAMGLGATVKVFDSSVYKLRRLQNSLGSRIITSVFQPKVLLKSLKTADVVIGAVHSKNGMTSCLISEDMVMQMKHGSVIIDVSIDQGGCIETSRVTSHAEPVFIKHNIIHYCVPNIASRVSRTASYALSNFFGPTLLQVGEEGGVDNLIKIESGIRNGVYIYNGVLTNSFIGKKHNIPSQDIDLLITALR